MHTHVHTHTSTHVPLHFFLIASHLASFGLELHLRSGFGKHFDLYTFHHLQIKVQSPQSGSQNPAEKKLPFWPYFTQML